MKIGDIMTKDVRHVTSSDPVMKAVNLMRDINVGAVPVVDGQSLVGIVTDRDILTRCIAEGQDPSKCHVSAHMSADLATAKPSTDIDEALHLMADRQVRRLPVVEGDRLVGIVTLGDLAVETKGEDKEIEASLKKISVPVHQTERGLKKAV